MLTTLYAFSLSASLYSAALQIDTHNTQQTAVKEITPDEKRTPPVSDQKEDLSAINRHTPPESKPAIPERNWLDLWHGNLTDSFDYSARQLDEFFALEGNRDHEEARAEGRIRVGWEPRSRNMGQHDLRFRIRVKLPALEDRVDLLFSDDQDFDKDDTIKAARDPETYSRQSATLAIRFRKDKEARLSHRIGAGRRDQLFVKSQFDDVMPITDTLSLDYEAEVYYYTRDQLGAELGLSFQQLLPNDEYLKFNNRYYYRSRSDDWVWRHSLQHLVPRSPNSATIFTLYAEGGNKPNYRLNEVYTSMRWRTNPMREWLYFEVEPFVVWLREENFRASLGMALRVEMYYGKS